MTKLRYSLEYKCIYVAFYLDNLEKDSTTSLTSETSKHLNLDRRVFTRWVKA